MVSVMKMAKKLRELFLKYKPMVLYLFFGGITTLVNIVVYLFCTELFHIHYLVSNVAAWVLAVLVAYVTNRIWVFESDKRSAKAIILEFGLFVSARLLSGVSDMITMFFCVDIIGMNGLAAKIIANVVVVVLNYVFSKWIVFRKRT